MLKCLKYFSLCILKISLNMDMVLCVCLTGCCFVGDLLIIMAQIIVACQMVYEEKVITKYNVPPLQAIGWEGEISLIDKIY